MMIIEAVWVCWLKAIVLLLWNDYVYVNGLFANSIPVIIAISNVTTGFITNFRSNEKVIERL